MPNAVTTLLRAAGGPRRLRAELRRATTAVRRAAESPTCVYGVGFAFPPSVLGGQVADLMGEQLRSMLRFWDDAPGAVRDDRQTRRPAAARREAAPLPAREPRRENGSVSAEEARSAWPPGTVPPAGSASRAFGRAAAPERGSRRPVGTAPTETAVITGSTVARPGSGPTNGATTRREYLTPTETAAVTTSAFAGRGPEASSDAALPREVLAAVTPFTGRRSSERGPIIPSALATALRTYWSRQPSDPNAVRAVATGPAPAGDDTVRLAWPAATEARPVARSDEWTRTGLALGGRLRDILARPASPADLLARPAAPPPEPVRASAGVAALDPTAWSAYPAAGVARLAESRTAPGWAAGDLAEQIADVLREEAIRQGIELT